MVQRQWGIAGLLAVAAVALWLLLGGPSRLLGLDTMLGLSSPQRLQWATHLMIANLLVFALMGSCLVEYAACGVHYWRDRR